MAKDVAAPDRIAKAGGDAPRQPTPLEHAGEQPVADQPDEALAALFAPARTLKRVGPYLEGALSRLFGLPGGVTARRLDLLWHLPQAVVDRSLVDGYAGAAEGERLTLAVVVQQHQPPPRLRRGRAGALRQPYRVRCATAAGGLHLVFFRAREAYLREALPEGGQRVVSGILTRYGQDWQIVHPELILAPAEFALTGPVQPIYPLTQGLSGRVLGGLIRQALDGLPELAEWQDPAWLAQRRWPSFAAALGRLHRPTGAADVALDSPARQRLAFDELLANQLALALVRRSATQQAGRVLTGDGRLRRAVLGALPFRLTAGQRQVLAAIEGDMARPARMLRLLQGDVGSGKTLVALLAMLAAVEAGGQAALMAPTEVLARQHQATLARLLAPAGLEPALLTGRERGAGRARLLADLASGRARIVVGTHALFQTGVAFADLAFAVIDEQHRFGVHQRLGLAAKGRQPDLLVMTATPIPRTLVLALYGDMAVSELREKPPGRQAIRTSAMPLARLDHILVAVERALLDGERIYWVCPLIGGAEDADQAAAERRYQALEARFGSPVGLVHGRMPAADKDRAMRRFAAGEIRLLVATTVIEVGVDVPEATVIVIEQAERFGLAQLHQLRGRVGRGARPSSCLLLYGAPLAPVARARLQIMRATDDGFRIAEEDLRLRGPGEVLGARQSGLPALRLADLAVHADLLAPARDDVRLCLRRDPDLESPRGGALRRLLRLFERAAAVAYLGSG
ncbi:MAG TPA: ATP-dependent DNA helicase RecG [Geminicoccaceae bacterium]|nr:ATP-dependent DNA helicase RecG [Geminicoccaceae bacterium]